jgi:hypothetical protein
MHPQAAHRLAAAIGRHRGDFVTYLMEFSKTGFCPSAQYLSLGDDTLYITIDPYDLRAVRLSRKAARSLANVILTEGLDIYNQKILSIALREDLRTNPPQAVVSRSLKHRASHLHRSGKTRLAKAATIKGREQDAIRALEFRKACIGPATMCGRHKDVKPVTIHTPRPTGKQGARP